MRNLAAFVFRKPRRIGEKHGSLPIDIDPRANGTRRALQEQRSEENCNRLEARGDHAFHRFISIILRSIPQSSSHSKDGYRKLFHVPATPRGPRVTVLWFHNPKAQESVLRAMTSSTRSFSEERLLLREITHRINNEFASVTQAGVSYGDTTVVPLLSNLRSYGRICFLVSGTMASIIARRRVRQVLFAAALLGAGLTPTFGAELISPLAGFQANLGSVVVSIYYEPTDTRYQVVITAGAEEPDSVIRFVSNLAPGQGAVVSVPRGAGQPARELYLHRVGDQLELERSSNND
jgi:hypothetical protein